MTVKTDTLKQFKFNTTPINSHTKKCNRCANGVMEVFFKRGFAFPIKDNSRKRFFKFLVRKNMCSFGEILVFAAFGVE